MIYVYDVLVNLNEEMYDFYDWEENDNFVHVRRVPIFKLSDDVFYDFVTKKIKVSEDFIYSIKDKTQVFSSRNIEIIKFAAIFSNGKNAVMIEFDGHGFIKRKSGFLVNEEMEIIDVTSSLTDYSVNYEVKTSKVKTNTMTRNEKKVLNDIILELEAFKEDKERIDYLYYEWFEKTDGDNKYDLLVKDIKNSFTFKHEEFLELLNLLTIKK